ncbi:LuxR C-terminal-related transcriptional regulator [Actinomycetospora endophytica]|uniref:LuxR C-terminal-related transcriptional regulator n=1 Tax=Actinomycetospora endophytica TaxID=2291215 RepID=A0ABS8PC48_9PSEU|nr:LuxR family transcriptional regulator [Actinomycetospora endophytica]MCD2195724.1 LuxR C-terminal-related transcriptional regulator [Actinomycetospora endophytica]
MTTAPISPPPGRTAETDRLSALIDHLDDGGGGALLVRGGTGIGKTSLLAWAVGLAGGCGVRVLTMRGSDAERDVPYAALRRLVSPLMAGLDQLPPRTIGTLCAVLERGGPTVPDVFATAQATLELLTVAEDGPLLVVVDDAHALDGPTAQVLGFVARRLDADPVALLLAGRSPGEPFALAGLPTLTVPPLRPADAAALLDAHHPGLHPAAREAVLHDAAGNPLALRELPTVLGDDRWPPDPGALPLDVRLERASARRLDGLDPLTRAALLAAASDTRADTGEVLLATARLTGVAVGDDALATAVAAGVIDLDADGHVRFSHPLAASALRSQAGPTRRREVHRALAEVVGDPHVRLAHLSAAAVGPDDDLADRLAEQARRSRGLGVPDAAVMPLLRSARLCADPARRADRLLEAAEIALDGGRPALAGRVLDDVAEPAPDRLTEIRGLRLRARLDGSRPDPRTGTAELIGLADEARELGDDALAVAVLAVAAQRCWWSYPDEATRAALVAAAHRLPLDPLDPRMLAMLAQAAPLECNAEIRRRLGRRPGAAPDPESGALLGLVDYVVADYAAASAVLAQADAGLRAQGRLASVGALQTLRAFTEVDRGAWDTAAESAAEALRLVRESGREDWLGDALIAAALLADLYGDTDRAASLDAEAEELVRDGHDTTRGMLRCSRGIRAAHRGHAQEATTLLGPLFDLDVPGVNPRNAFCGAIPLADAAAHTGDPGTAWWALARIRDLVARAGPDAPPGLLAAADHAEAVLGPEDGADGRFVTALGRADLRPFDRARLELAHARRLLRDGRTGRARSALRRAHAGFEALGNGPLATVAAAELARLGEPGVGPRHPAWQRLTTQEAQIARLVADGLTNREIGGRLFLSHRTVGSHLYRMFPKLGISSRVELARFVLGLDGA